MLMVNHTERKFAKNTAEDTEDQNKFAEENAITQQRRFADPRNIVKENNTRSVTKSDFMAVGITLDALTIKKEN